MLFDQKQKTKQTELRKALVKGIQSWKSTMKLEIYCLVRSTFYLIVQFGTTSLFFLTPAVSENGNINNKITWQYKLICIHGTNKVHHNHKQ